MLSSSHRRAYAAFRDNRPLVVLSAATVAFLVLLAAVFERQAIINDFTSGKTITAQFSSAYKLTSTSGLAPASKVKIAGSPVGSVTGIKSAGNGLVDVSMKINTDVWLGTAPTATIRPTTALGGNYYVELEPGGTPATFNGSVIPATRTHLPVELDTVLQAFPGPTQKAIQSTTSELDRTLNGGGAQALNQLLAQAPKTLVPTEPVAQAALGTNPATDLPTLVADLDNAAVALTAKDGQLGNVLDLLDQTGAVLAREAPALQTTLADMPATLSSTRTGLTALKGTLNQLTSTAQVAQPAIQQINPLLTALNPVLVQLEPVLQNLQPVLQQAQPLVSELVPTSTNATTILDEVKGPVLQKLNGPILGTIVGDWKGVGPKYAGGGNDNLALLGGKPQTFYQALAYFVSNLDRSTQKYDSSGFMTDLTAAVGAGTLGGLPQSIQGALEKLVGVAVPGGGGT